jgi:hypothetical protein
MHLSKCTPERHNLVLYALYQAEHLLTATVAAQHRIRQQDVFSQFRKLFFTMQVKTAGNIITYAGRKILIGGPRAEDPCPRMYELAVLF